MWANLKLHIIPVEEMHFHQIELTRFIQSDSWNRSSPILYAHMTVCATLFFALGNIRLLLTYLTC